MASIVTNTKDDNEKKPTKKMVARGEIDDLMDLHRNNLNQLKERLSDLNISSMKVTPPYDDIFLLRYLLSNVKNPQSDKGLDTTEAAIRRTIKWREENQTVLTNIANGKGVPFEKEWQKYMGIFRTFQRNKGPVNFVILNHSSPKQLMDDFPSEQVQRFMLMTREEDFLICDKLTRESRKIVKCISVVDLYDMSVFSGDADRRFAKALGDSSNMSTDLYPQFLAKTVLVNLPSVMNWVIRIMKMFMSERTVNKIQFQQGCGHGLPKSQGDLSKLIDMDDDQVPDFLGGTFDTTEALKETKQRREDTVTVTIPARTCNECRIKVPEAGAMIAYLVKVEARNVILTAEVVNDSGPPVELFSSRKVNASEGTLTGNWVAPLPGTLVIKFDNSYSMMRSKTIRYCVKIISKRDAVINDTDMNDSDGV